MKRPVAAAFALLLVAAGDPPEWTAPQAPFPLIGGIDYVGSRGIAAYLIHTKAGAILIDGTLAANADMVADHIRAMGVPLDRVRLILLTHAHFDHVGAVAALQRLTGAKVVAGLRDVDALAAGRPPGETNYTPVGFPPVRVDVGVTDGRVLRLGDTLVEAIATPGHTPGCTSWLTRVTDKGRPLEVLFPRSVTVAGNRLVGNRRYPGIVADYRASLARLAHVHPDVVLPAHPEIADVIGRAHTGTLVDRTLWPRILAQSRAAFEAELATQAAGG